MNAIKNQARDYCFRLFNRALSEGHGVQVFADRLMSMNDDVNAALFDLRKLSVDPLAIFTEWQDNRARQVAEAEVNMLDRGDDVFTSVTQGLISGEADTLFDCGKAFPMLEVGPGLMTVIGAPPGRGKTALSMQVLYDAVANETGLQAVVASLEVTADTLVKRRLAMLAGVSFDAIRFNNLTELQRQKLANESEFKAVLANVGFVKRNHSGLGDLEELLRFRKTPGLLLLDYVQLFGDTESNAQDRGMQTMKTAMRFCDAGWAVIAVSAVNRSSYAKGDIGSFRDTSSIEYSGTSAYMLDEVGEYADDESKPPIREMKLRALKNRNGGLRSIDLVFDGPKMLFSARDLGEFSNDFNEWNSGEEVATTTLEGASW